MDGRPGIDEFNLFSHELLLLEGKPLEFTYEALRMGVLELYLSVKIRSDHDIDNYDEQAFAQEKEQLGDCDGFALIEMIKNSVELLMHMKDEEQYRLARTNLNFYGDGRPSGLPSSSGLARGGTEQFKQRNAGQTLGHSDMDTLARRVRPASHRQLASELERESR